MSAFPGQIFTQGEMYHKLVKTTPNPNATKKSNGELVGPGLPPPPAGAEDVAAGGPEVDVEDIVPDIDEVMMGKLSTVSTQV